MTSTEYNKSLPREKNLSESLVPFEKIHGLGNDFVLVDVAHLPRLEGGAKEARVYLSELARRLCRRHRGIGADGLIVAVRPGLLANPAIKDCISSYKDAEHAEFSWIYLNSDGSESVMCGNGLRCLALFMERRGWLEGRKNFAVTVAGGPVEIELSLEDSNASCAVVRTRLAAPSFDAPDIPRDMVNAPITLADGEIVFGTAVNMGNPHVVLFAGRNAGLDWSGYPLDMQCGLALDETPSTKKNSSLLQMSEQIQSSSQFPSGVNVSWARVESAERVRVYVVERGCGPTLACASGAAAVVCAGVKEGLLNPRCCVILPGGELEVLCLDNGMGQVELTGKAEFVFAGKVALACEDRIR